MQDRLLSFDLLFMELLAKKHQYSSYSACIRLCTHLHIFFAWAFGLSCSAVVLLDYMFLLLVLVCNALIFKKFTLLFLTVLLDFVSNV